MKCVYTNLHRCGMGMAMGVLGAVFTALFAVLAMWGYGQAYVDMVGSIYIGYAATFAGMFLGALWGFVEGFIIGYLFAWLYNAMLSRCCKDGKCEEHSKKHR